MFPGTIQKGLVDTGKRKLITGQDVVGWGLERVVLGGHGTVDTHTVKGLCAHVCVYKSVEGEVTFSCSSP